MRPVVGVPASHLANGRVRGWLRGGFGLPETYVAALARAGVRTVLLPADRRDPAGDLLAAVDGVLLAGGGDVDPARYGGLRHPATYGIDTDRDAVELELVLAADGLGVPVLAVCRGLQVLNVAFGGTLHAHLPDLPGHVPHGSPVEGSTVAHTVRATGGSRLAKACGTEIPRCTSHHHQGVHRLGEGLVAVAWTDDGLVEAVERPDGWIVGVQWHPEMTAGEDAVQQSLFDAFAEQLRR